MTTDLIINILSSIIVGGAVWLGGKVQRVRKLNRKANFFGLRPGGKCHVIINQNPKSPGNMNQGDVQSLADIFKIVYEIRAEAIITPFDKIQEPPGFNTEFCLGGPLSNRRTKEHLDNYLKGVRINPYIPGDINNLAIITETDYFRYEKHQKEYSVLARFRPASGSQPVFLVCGQTPIANMAAAHYLAQNYDKTLRKQYKDGPFCLILNIFSTKTYGYKGAELVKDITREVFPVSGKSA